jgi:hypothetical protein
MYTKYNIYVYIVKLPQLNMNIHTVISLAMDGGVWTGDGLCACYLKVFQDWGGVRPSLMVRPGPEIGPGPPRRLFRTSTEPALSGVM